MLVLESELGLALESPSEPMLELVSGLPWGLGLESASELELDSVLVLESELALESASVSQSALELGLE